MVEEHASGGDPSRCVVESVDRTLALARTWLAWDGRPHVSEDGDRVYTPNKVIRRMTDHLLDHLAEIEALLVGAPTIPDHWHGSLVTTAGDWAPFTEVERDEAEQRLTRLAAMYALRFTSVGAEEWDRSRAPNQTLREIAEHVGVAWYAEQMGDLSQPRTQG